VASLRDRLNEDLKQAMKDRDAVRRMVIRTVLSSIHNAEIARRGELEEPDLIGVVAKEARQHEESIEAFKQGDRQDLVDVEQAELAILQEYLPQQASREEVVEAARRVIAEVGAEGPRDKGRVMPRLISEFKGKADGRQINEVVTELLG
jgi:uncharacterized protein YqeY